MDYQLTQTGPEVQEILDKGAESYSKAEIDAQVDELQDGIDSSVKNKGSESNIVVGVGNSSNIGITSSSIGMETGNSAILIGNDITMNTSGEVKYNGSRVATAADLQGKQDVIRDLQTIREGAAAGATAVQPAALTPIQNALQTIEDVIPSTASAQNKLTDKNYVDNSISTNTANFVGTFETLAELQAVQNPTNNDYGFVIETDAQGNEYYDRYKFNGSQWLFEYKVESTPFTAAQWAAIQSGITSALVTKLNNLPTSTELTTQLSGKQDTISDLSTIRSGAAAGATAVQPATLQSELATKQDTIADLSTIRSNAANAAANTGDKAYDVGSFSGLGRVNLHKNIIEVSGTNKNVLTQAMVSQANTIYVIQYDYDLNGQTITLPAGCVLEFDGGSLANGVVVGNGTKINSAESRIFYSVSFEGYFAVDKWFAEWFGICRSEDDNSSLVNSAISSLSALSSANLYFSDIYTIKDTIYLQQNVSFVGAFQRTRPTSSKIGIGTIIADFSTANKWMIDSKDENGNVIPFDNLDTNNTEFAGNQYKRNIVNLALMTIGSEVPYGGIRTFGINGGNFENIYIQNAVIGFVLSHFSWNVSIRNVAITYTKIGLYCGDACTSINIYNATAARNDSVDSSLTAFPTLPATALPSHVTFNDVAFMFVADTSFTGVRMYGCSVQYSDVAICGCKFMANVYGLRIESLAKSVAYIDGTGASGVLPYIFMDEPVHQNYQKLQSYTFAAKNALIKAKGFNWSTCWQGDGGFYDVYNSRDTTRFAYYDEVSGSVYTINDNKNINGFDRFGNPRVIVANNTDKEAYGTGVHYTFAREVYSRFDKVTLQGSNNSTDFTSGTLADHLLLKNKDIKVVTKANDFRSTGIYIHGCKFEIFNATAINVATGQFIFGVYGGTNWLIFPFSFGNNSTQKLLKLLGNEDVVVHVQSNTPSTYNYFTQKNYLDTTDFKGRYVIYLHAADGSVHTIHTNTKGATTERPSTLTASEVGFEFFDTTLGRPVYWNGSAWIDATGATV